jgi:chromosome segregation ATPase
MKKERDELEKGLTSARGAIRRHEAELVAARTAIGERDQALTEHQAAITARDQRIAELGTQNDELEGENATYQEQVLKAYQKITTDEATVARAKKALAIALTTLDDTPKPQS